MLESVLVFSALLLAGTLLASGVLKLRDLAATEQDIRGLDVLPAGTVRFVARVLPVVEVVLGASMLLARGTALVVAGVLTAALMATFTVVVVRLAGREDEVSCACFGSASQEPVSTVTVVRNVGLLGLAVVVAATALPAVGLLPALVGAPVPAVVFAVLSAVGLAAVVVLLGQISALRARVEDVSARLAAAEAAPLAPEPVEIPDAVVVDPQGVERTLVSLSSGKAQFVIGVSPGCSACHDLVPALPQWRHSLGAEVDVVVVVNTDRESALTAYADHDEYLYSDPTGQVFSALGIAGTPAAVLLGTNGKVAAGPSLGAEAILELLTAVVQAIGVNMMTGQSHQAQEPRSVGGEDHGSEYLPDPGYVVEDVRVRDEEGRELALSEALERVAPRRDVAVVSWRNGCGYCGEIVEQMKFFSAAGDVVLLVNEPVSSVREQGIEGPAFQTVDADASGLLGVMGTPSGYPVRDLVMQPGGGVGGGSVLRMLRDRAVEAGTITAEQAQHPELGGSVADWVREHDHHDGHDHAGHAHAHS